MMPSIAAGRAGKARLFEHRDVRVRAGARPARSAGKSSQPDVGEAVMPGANGFGYFPRKESNPRRGMARKKTWMSNSKDTGSRLSSLIKARPSMAALRVAGMTSLETMGYNQLPYLRMYTRFTTCV